MDKLDRLDILINNAGQWCIMEIFGENCWQSEGLPTVADYTLSPQGIETIWATNGWYRV
jgi:NAD(P)-dependent dehydrogenase (short-subunit alcohol dehydrogenase family)